LSGSDYFPGFGGHFETEAVPGALPKDRGDNRGGAVTQPHTNISVERRSAMDQRAEVGRAGKIVLEAMPPAGLSGPRILQPFVQHLAIGAGRRIGQIKPLTKQPLVEEPDPARVAARRSGPCNRLDGSRSGAQEKALQNSEV